MLTRNHRQEALSKTYVRAIAAQAGLICVEPELDYGIDLALRSIERKNNRYRDTGVQLDIQLKSSTRTKSTDAEVVYDLEVAAYNDLCDANTPCPRILVLLALPDDESQWLKEGPQELCLRQCAWWLSLKGSAVSSASSTVRIAIPVSNVFSVAAVTAIMQRLRERKDP